ncbi:transcription repressor OFP15-like protein [Carex littledalei]|uniref:Transcription repressor n=1 Tax=Carex littledalei TaxID=544730 RepID=A0A833VV48_9POAL|nr:transcription repressor OFP15-like protein [Carex littledalei]
MVKSFGFTSFFTKTTKDNNEPWPSCKNQNTDCEQNLIFNKITEEHDATFDLSKDVVGLTESDRLFFEPGYGTKSIMEAAGVKVAQKNVYSTVTGSFKGGVAMAMESKDPYRDFRESMEQMVRVHGVKDWDWLQEMLGWYLRANGMRTHGIILGAFVDLLMSLAKSHNSSNLSNHISSCSSCSCFSFEIEEGIERR